MLGMTQIRTRYDLYLLLEEVILLSMAELKIQEWYICWLKYKSKIKRYMKVLSDYSECTWCIEVLGMRKVAAVKSSSFKVLILLGIH